MKFKCQFFACFFLLVTAGSFAQNTFPSSGNVGIGISSPYWPLEVNGVIKSSIFFLGNDMGFHPIAGGQSVIQSWWGLQLAGLSQEYPSSYNSNNIGSSASAHVIIPMVNTSAIGLHIKGVGSQGGNYMSVSSSSGTGDVLALNSSGYLGIGTSTPNNMLDVSGRGGFSNGIVLTGVPSNVSDVNYIQASNSSSTVGFLAGTGVFSAGSGAYFGARGNTYSAIGGQRGMMFFSAGAVSSPSGFEGNIVFNTTPGSGTGESPRMVINRDGNIGIGTTTPQSKLAVNGTITTTKLKVTQTGWPDYVFENGYSLPTLQEIEAFIKAHKHLPGVASKKEVETEGLDVAENQAVLLKKIEEMTLYMIEMKKQIDDQQKKITQLEKQAANK